MNDLSQPGSDRLEIEIEMEMDVPEDLEGEDNADVIEAVREMVDDRFKPDCDVSVRYVEAEADQ